MYNTNNSRKEYEWSYSRCFYFFLIDSSQCLQILWKQLSPSNIQWSYWQLIEFWRFVYIMKLYGFGRNRLSENFSIWHRKGVDSTYNLSNDLFLVKQHYMGTYVFKICKILEISSWFVNILPKLFLLLVYIY
jgi:hypothetical protein